MRHKLEIILENRLRVPVLFKSNVIGVHRKPEDPPEIIVIEVNDVLKELLADFRKVLTNGSIRLEINGYYSNLKAIQDSDDIQDKWFGENKR